jgi:hypothetical protein
MPPNGIIVKSPLGGTAVVRSLPADVVLPPPVGGTTPGVAAPSITSASERSP